MLLWAWCPDAALPEHTQHAILLFFFLSWSNTSEETVQLWSLSRGNVLTSLLRTHNVTSGKARWLTAFSQCGGPFHLLHHSKFMMLKHTYWLICHKVSALLRTPGRQASLWAVWRRSVAFPYRHSGVFLQVAGLTDTQSICQLKDSRWAGSSWAPAARTAS